MTAPSRVRPGAAGPLVIIGDTILDVDLDGSSQRQCPDAPAPVLDLHRRRLRPGGAGLAALLAARAGEPVQLVTGLGRDEAADTLLRLLAGDLEVLPQSLQGSTVTKTRIRLGESPLVRVDSGTGTSGAGPLTAEAAAALDRAGAVLVCDYGRGMAGQPELRRRLADVARHVPVVWDPHPRGARPVPGASLLTPNEAEADRAAPGAADEQTRGAELCRLWDSPAVAVTVGERGAVLTRAAGHETETVPVPAERRVDAAAADTCGAGDRFAGAAAAGLRAGLDVRAAVADAVAAAATFVGGGGASGHSVLDRDLDHPPGPATADVDTLIARTRRSGGRVVATGGCFDLLHRGHVTLLERARELGDLLVVCLNSDASVRRAKGPERPVVAQHDRARVLTALAAVDAVVVFDEDTPAALLERIRPDIWVKGHDYVDRELPETVVVTRHGGRLVLLPLVDGYSTTRLVGAGRHPVPVAT